MFQSVWMMSKNHQLSIQGAKKATHLVPAILETWITHLVEELAWPGQKHIILRWESTTTAETLIMILRESGATPMVLMGGVIALFQSVQTMNKNHQPLILHLSNI